MRLVVIGGVAAGLSAASRARRMDSGLDIVVLEKGDVVSYGACGLPYFVEGRVEDWRDLVVYTPDFFSRQRKIQVRTGAEVRVIEHSRRRVELSTGEKVPYDKLIIATGARQNTAGITGHDLPHVFSMNTPAAAVRLKQRLSSSKAGRAVIIGGGYIGLEAVEALRTHGWRLTLVDGGETLLHGNDGELTRRIATHLDRFRVDLRQGHRVKAITEDAVDGIPASLVVLAAGLKPNAELAAAAGLEMGPTGAIRVNERMETSLGGIYAAGDCAETTHLVSGRAVWTPLGTTANKMGRVAGACAAGARERFPGIVGTSIVRVCGLGVAATGLSTAQAARDGFTPVSVWIRGRDRANYFGGRPTEVQLVADRSTGRLLGGCILGEYGVEGRINVLATALQAGMKLDQFEQLDLAYAPPFAPVWDPLLIAAQQLRKQL
jgi:NADPH-dependent 2,4-dienoyl-CoA reductase/sulfur reductase-like enzyme